MKNKDFKDIMNEAKDYNPTDEDIMIIENLTDAYKDKTEDDIFVEIIKVNDKMQENMTREEYDAIFEKLNAMRSILDENQVAKLDMVLEVLNRDR